jgi:hypothetical protein
MFRRFPYALLLAAAMTALPGHCATTVRDLAGIYTLTAAYDIRPDGSRSDSYGPQPRGMLYMGDDGKYSLQIYHTVRPPFASPDYAKASADEYRNAVLTASTHFGSFSVDAARQTLTFRIDGALNARWDKSEQTRPFDYKDGELSYRVPAKADGNIPVSVWRRTR